MTASILLALFAGIVASATWFVTSRVWFARGMKAQKALHDALARFDAESDPFHDLEAARHERAVKRCGDQNLHAALHGLTFPPAIDLRDNEGRWN